MLLNFKLAIVVSDTENKIAPAIMHLKDWRFVLLYLLTAKIVMKHIVAPYVVNSNRFGILSNSYIRLQTKDPSINTVPTLINNFSFSDGTLF